MGGPAFGPGPRGGGRDWDDPDPEVQAAAGGCPARRGGARRAALSGVRADRARRRRPPAGPARRRDRPPRDPEGGPGRRQRALARPRSRRREERLPQEGGRPAVLRLDDEPRGRGPRFRLHGPARDLGATAPLPDGPGRLLVPRPQPPRAAGLHLEGRRDLAGERPPLAADGEGGLRARARVLSGAVAEMKKPGKVGNEMRAYVDGVEINRIPELAGVCAMENWLKGLLDWAAARP